MPLDLPPPPRQAQMTDDAGIVSTMWHEWFKLLSGTSSVAASGYLKLPGGLIIQWGVTGSVTSGSTQSITLPVSFPNDCLWAMACPKANSAVATSATGQVGVGNYAEDSFDVYNRTSVTHIINWVALGN